MIKIKFKLLDKMAAPKVGVYFVIVRGTSENPRFEILEHSSYSDMVKTRSEIMIEPYIFHAQVAPKLGLKGNSTSYIRGRVMLVKDERERQFNTALITLSSLFFDLFEEKHVKEIISKIVDRFALYGLKIQVMKDGNIYVPGAGLNEFASADIAWANENINGFNITDN